MDLADDESDLVLEVLDVLSEPLEPPVPEPVPVLLELSEPLDFEFESDVDDLSDFEEDSELLLSLASFISRERLRVP